MNETVSIPKKIAIGLFIIGFIFAKVYSFFKAGIVAIVLGVAVLFLSETQATA